MLSSEQIQPHIDLVNAIRNVTGAYLRQTKENRQFILFLLRQSYDDPDNNPQHRMIRTFLSELDRSTIANVGAIENGQVNTLRIPSGG